MPGTTPNLKIPYPLPADAVTDYPATGQNLATLLDSLIQGNRYKSTAHLSLVGTTAIPNNAQQPLQLNAAYDFNNDAVTFPVRSASSAMIVSVAGYYLVTAMLGYPSNATGVRWTAIWRNGAQLTPAFGNLLEDLRAALNGIYTGVPIAGLVRLNANDYLQLVGWQSSGVGLTPTLGGMSMTRLSDFPPALERELAEAEPPPGPFDDPIFWTEAELERMPFPWSRGPDGAPVYAAP